MDNLPHVSKADLKAVKAPDIAAGGGLGGLMIFLINGYVNDPTTKGAFVYLVPAFSIFMTGVWVKIRMYLEDEFSLWQAQKAIKRADKDYQMILTDAGATEDHKKVARARFELARMQLLEMKLKPLKG